MRFSKYHGVYYCTEKGWWCARTINKEYYFGGFHATEEIAARESDMLVKRYSRDQKSPLNFTVLTFQDLIGVWQNSGADSTVVSRNGTATINGRSFHIRDRGDFFELSGYVLSKSSKSKNRVVWKSAVAPDAEEVVWTNCQDRRSSFIGVEWSPTIGKWVVKRVVNKQTYHGGSWNTDFKAAVQSDEIVRLFGGPNCIDRLNFPTEKENFRTKYIGVSWDSELNQWEARRGLESAGFYNSDFEAAKASDRLQRAKDGINSNIGLNFPGIYSEDMEIPDMTDVFAVNLMNGLQSTKVKFVKEDPSQIIPHVPMNNSSPILQQSAQLLDPPIDTKCENEETLENASQPKEAKLWLVDKIEDHRFIANGSREFLVKWSGFTEPTWEPEGCLVQCSNALNSYFATLRLKIQICFRSAVMDWNGSRFSELTAFVQKEFGVFDFSLYYTDVSGKKFVCDSQTDFKQALWVAKEYKWKTLQLHVDLPHQALDVPDFDCFSPDSPQSVNNCPVS